MAAERTMETMASRPRAELCIHSFPSLEIDALLLMLERMAPNSFELVREALRRRDERSAVAVTVASDEVGAFLMLLMLYLSNRSNATVLSID